MPLPRPDTLIHWVVRRITRLETIISSPHSRFRSRCAHVRWSYLFLSRRPFAYVRTTQFACRIPYDA